MPSTNGFNWKLSYGRFASEFSFAPKCFILLSRILDMGFLKQPAINKSSFA
jgi:hypothetical protein